MIYCSNNRIFSNKIDSICLPYELGGNKIWVPVIVHLLKAIAFNIIFAYPPGVAKKQRAVIAPKKFYGFVIRKPLLSWYDSKILAIKFLYAIGKAQPAKIIFVEGHIQHIALEQAFIYIIAEWIVPFYRLSWASYTHTQ